jgi:hypothetical protein
MSLYEDLINAGIETANHSSDLYFPVTPETTEILDRHPLEKKIAKQFRNNQDGKQWYDVPFAFLPYWEGKTHSNKG